MIKLVLNLKNPTKISNCCNCSIVLLEPATSDDGVQVVGFKITTETPRDDNVTEDSSSRENTFVTLNRGSMNDYFLQKMKMKASGEQAKRSESHPVDISNEPDHSLPSEGQEKKRKNKGSKQMEVLSEEKIKTLNGEAQLEDETIENCKRKKKKKLKDDSVEDSDLKTESPIKPDDCQEEAQQEEIKNKRKKKKKSKSNKNDNEFETEQSESNGNKEVVAQRDENPSSKDEDTREGKKKKKKRNFDDQEEPSVEQESDNKSTDIKKKKKSKKSKKDRLDECHDTAQQTPFKKGSEKDKRLKTNEMAIFKINHTSKNIHKSRINKKKIVATLKTSGLESKLGYKGASLGNILGYGSHAK